VKKIIEKIKKKFKFKFKKKSSKIFKITKTKVMAEVQNIESESNKLVERQNVSVKFLIL
jgi:hypothetical protein